MANIPGQPTMGSGSGSDRAASESRVDRDSHFNGLYKTKQNLRIEGVAEGEIQCDGVMTVAEGARVNAKVTANTATIAGELEGEVICNGTFQIMPSGQVQANVQARRLVVHEGGFYNGEFHMITDSASGRSSDRIPSLSERARESSKSEAAPKDEWWAKMTSVSPEEPDKQAS